MIRAYHDKTQIMRDEQSRCKRKLLHDYKPETGSRNADENAHHITT